MNQRMLFDADTTVLSVFIGDPIQVKTKGDRSRAVQLALLTAILESQCGRASADDIVRDSSRPYPEGGKWLGPAIRQLSDDGLIRTAGANRSRRTARKGGLLCEWELLDRTAAQVRVKRLRAVLALRERTDPVAVTTESAANSRAEPSKETEHERTDILAACGDGSNERVRVLSSRSNGIEATSGNPGEVARG